MAVVEPWQRAEISGPKHALVITKPEVVVAMIRRAKRPVFIVGHEAAEIDLGRKKIIDYVIQLAKKCQIPVVATAQTVKYFLRRDFTPAGSMPAVDIGNRLADATWTGVDGKGRHDLALFTGLPYYMEWTILSGLKHYAPDLKTITLDNVYHPNASWSFANIPLKDLHENFKVIVKQFEGGGK